MHNMYSFTPIEIENIINRFGQSFYDKVLKDFEKYAARWGLSEFRLMPSYSANLVFKCYSEVYGDVLLNTTIMIKPDISGFILFDST